MKKCSKCKNIKEDNSFYSNKYMKSGLSSRCKECQKIAAKLHNDNNPDYKEYIIEYRRKYYNKNNEYFKEYLKKWNSIHSPSIERQKYIREFNNKNYKRYKNSRNKYQRNRRKTDPLYKLSKNIRASISVIFSKNNYIKMSRTHQILCCSYEEFKQYLESKMENWMSWNNYGKYNGELNYGWDMDHIIPVSSANSEEELIRLNHYSNFQPLCSYINRNIKKDSI